MIIRHKVPAIDRLHRRAISTPQPIDSGLPTQCLLFPFSLNAGGYGGIRVGRTEMAHIVSYVALVGPISAGLELDHLCRVR